MNFTNHSNLAGQHAFLSPSKYHWLGYDKEKLIRAFFKYEAATKGTRLHSWACETIKLGLKQAKSKKTIYMYVNDAIGFQMEPEQVLYYSNNCFGTADTISFRNNVLRIHDLKTGETPASIRQLQVLAAIFCLEYDYAPENIGIELRIYQDNDVLIDSVDNLCIRKISGEVFEHTKAEDIRYIMDKIIHDDKTIEELKIGG